MSENGIGTEFEQGDEELIEEVSAMEQAMTSELRQEEGTFFTGGNAVTGMELGVERELDEERVLNPLPVRDGQPLLDFLRNNLHKFESPHSFIGGEANTNDVEDYYEAEVKVLIARLSTYESVSLSMSHSLMAQIYRETGYAFSDFAFLPKPKDYDFLRDNAFPVWFGSNTKLGPDKFDLLSITHAVAMEQLNFISLLHDSGIPIFKDQRMERPEIPLIVVGGMNAGTIAPLCGSFTDSEGRTYSHLIDAMVYGDGETAGKQLLSIIRDGKKQGLSKREILRNCHGQVDGFYEPDCYEHVYAGGTLTEIKRAEGCDYAEFPVTRSIVEDLNTVRTLEEKVLPYTGDGMTIDVAISGSVGCIGAAGWGACSFCREGSEGPWRERSVEKVFEGIGQAVLNQGTKEVSFFSLNFNNYSDFFGLTKRAVEDGLTVGLISQRVDMLAETPEQIQVQRYLKKHQFTLGVEGISSRMRAYLNKNLQEWELLKCAAEMMKEGAGELKWFMIITGLEKQEDMDEFCELMEKVNIIRDRLKANTRFRVSFTPLFPAAWTALQFAPIQAALQHGSKSLTPIFQRAKELGWGRRLSVSGEEPLVSNTINHGGRNIMGLLLDAHFRDDWRFYGRVAKGTWVRWQERIDADLSIDLEELWGEKEFEYIFPWEDIAYSTSKEILFRGYMKAVAYQGLTYCLSTRTVKGICRGKECGCCDPDKDGKPNKELIRNIAGRKMGPVIPPAEFARVAKSRAKTNHLRVLFETRDPIYRYVQSSYFQYVIPRALMKASPQFAEAYDHALGHARISAGANQAKDYTFGQNIFDFALSEHMTESEVRGIIPAANEILREGRIVEIRVDSHLSVLRNDVDFAVYSMMIPNSVISYQRLRQDTARYFERKSLGRDQTIKVKTIIGKDMYRTEEQNLDGKDVRALTLDFIPEERGSLLRLVVSALYNPLSLLEAITGRRAFMFKSVPIFCDGYVKLSMSEGETDVFAALSGKIDRCAETGKAIERNLFTGEPLPSGLSLLADSGIDANFPLDLSIFQIKDMKAADFSRVEEVMAVQSI